MWVDIWNAATLADQRVATVKHLGPQAILQLLQSCDTCEISLRRLASYMYFNRTHDAVGAQHMLAVHAPGTLVDLAPTWMVSDATAHSRTEHSRNEVVRSEGRSHTPYQPQTPYVPKGRGKGKNKKKGGAPPHTPHK